MTSCRKCGTDLPERTLSCPNCGASQTLDVLLSVGVMKFLGIVCGAIGVALVVFGDQIDGPNPYVMWLWAGLFIVIGFVFFYRKWPEEHDL